MKEPEVRTLRQIRAGRLLSERALARESGITRTTVRKIENGQVCASNRSISQLCEALDIEPHEVKEFRDAIALRSGSVPT